MKSILVSGKWAKKKDLESISLKSKTIWVIGETTKSVEEGI
jgi:hypothetical protein